METTAEMTTTKPRGARPPTETLDALTDAEIAARLADAELAAEALTARATEAVRLAEEAAAAFRAHPSAATHTTCAVQSQLADNAAADARDTSAMAASLRAEHDRRQKLARVKALTPLADWPALMQRTREHVIELVSTLHNAMRREAEQLQADIATRNSAAAELEVLVRELGLPLDVMRRMDVGDAREWLCLNLPRELTEPRTFHYVPPGAAGAMSAGMIEQGHPALTLLGAGRKIDETAFVALRAAAYWRPESGS